MECSTRGSGGMHPKHFAKLKLFFWCVLLHFQPEKKLMQARRRGGSRGSKESPLEVNNGGLKTQTVDFQLLANSGGMENKLRVLQLLNYPARKR